MKCETITCPNAATARVFWPGQSRTFCDTCKARAQHVAGVMGFELSTATLEREPYEPPAIESSRDFAIETDLTACRECGSFVGFCHPACSSQGRD